MTIIVPRLKILFDHLLLNGYPFLKSWLLRISFIVRGAVQSVIDTKLRVSGLTSFFHLELKKFVFDKLGLERGVFIIWNSNFYRLMI